MSYDHNLYPIGDRIDILREHFPENGNIHLKMDKDSLFLVRIYVHPQEEILVIKRSHLNFIKMRESDGQRVNLRTHRLYGRDGDVYFFKTSESTKYLWFFTTGQNHKVELEFEFNHKSRLF